MVEKTLIQRCSKLNFLHYVLCLMLVLFHLKYLNLKLPYFNFLKLKNNLFQFSLYFYIEFEILKVHIILLKKI